MRTVIAIDQLNVDPNLVTDTPHAAFEDVVHPKLVTDLFCVYLFALVGERGISGDHETAGRRERSVVRSSVMPSTKYSCSGSFDKFAKGRTTIDSRGRANGATLPASRVLVVGAEPGAVAVGGARRLGMLPRTSPATRAANPREVDAACTTAETRDSDAITVASIA